MKKSLFIALICLSTFLTGQAQHFTNGLGVALIHDETKYSKDNPNISIAYTPGWTFGENRKYALSVNAPLRVGYSRYYYNAAADGVQVTDNWKSYIIQLPLMFNFNYGAGSSQKARNRVGFFVGAGYAAQYRIYKESYSDNITGANYKATATEFSTGVAFNGGIRFAVGKSYRRRNIELGMGYMVGLTGETHDLVSYHILYNF